MALSWFQVAQCQAVNPNEFIPTTQCVAANQTSTDFYKFVSETWFGIHPSNTNSHIYAYKDEPFHRHLL